MSGAQGRLLQLPPERDIRPDGWLLEQLRSDLRHGVVGHLDELAPDLVVADDIFGRDRLRPGVPAKDLGAASDDDAWAAQFQWWNAETQGNWRDGWVHHALWAGSAADAAKARAWAEGILATQDADGYLGIHAPELRFPDHGEHAELWGQTTLLRALLGYFRHTGDARVLRAVERAVARTMRGYPPVASEPFGRDASFGGVTHGLMFSDVLWELAGLTGERRLLAYAAWLYASFARSATATGDARAEDLLDARLGFRGHGVHTYEHWRALTVAAATAGGTAADHSDGLDLAELESAYDAKLALALTPAGGPNGDEFCHPRGSSDDTGYELCSVGELLHGYGRRVETTADAALGDLMESLLFNVGFGMRDPLGSGVAYLKTDNSRSMTGVEGFRSSTGDAPQTRYRYSPLHREAAVCCVPNWGRLLPTYLRYQWLLGGSGGRPQILVLLFGPSVLQASVDGVQVTVRQATDYPAETRIEFSVEVASQAEFSLAVRRPAWAGGASVTGIAGDRVSHDPGLVRVAGPWSGRTTLEVAFEAPVEVRPSATGQRLVGRGPLLYAQPIPGEREVTRRYQVASADARLEDVVVRPSGDARPFTLRDGEGRPSSAPPGVEAAQAPHLWQRQGVLLPMADDRGQTAERRLVPMGATTLRIVAFEPG